MPNTFDLAEATLAKLSTQTKFTTHDGTVPNKPQGAYVVFYGSTGTVRRTRLAQAANRLRGGCTLVIAGSTAAQVRNTVDLVRDDLEGWRPFGTDRSSEALHEDEISGDMLRDDTDANDIRFSQTLFFRLTTHRS